MPELELLRRLLAAEQAKNVQLEAKVTELTEWCREWREHHDYMVHLRAEVQRLCTPE